MLITNVVLSASVENICNFVQNITPMALQNDVQIVEKAEDVPQIIYEAQLQYEDYLKIVEIARIAALNDLAPGTVVECVFDYPAHLTLY